MINDIEMSCANCRRSHKDLLCYYNDIVAAGALPICESWAPKLARGEKLRPSCFECIKLDAIDYKCNVYGNEVVCPSEHQCENFNPYRTSPLLKRKKNEPPYLPGFEK